MTLASSDSSHISTQAQKTPLCLSQDLLSDIDTHNMADENALESKPAQSIPERPKDAPAAEAGAAPAAEGEKGPSKSALKKAAKEKEKVRLALDHT